MAKLALEQPEVRAQLPEIKAEDEFDALPDEAPEQPKAEKSSRFKPISIGDFCNGPEPEWLIDEVLPGEGLALGIGETSIGKSFGVVDMGLCVVRGVPWQGRKTKKGKVAYVCAEGLAAARKRFKAYTKYHNLALSDLDGMSIIPNAPNLREAKDAVELCAQLKALGPVAMIIIDTLARATPGANENSGEDMGLALKHCQMLGQATDALIFLVHHLGKDASKGARGWSGIKAAADTEIEFTRLAGMHRRVTLTKQRDAEDNLQFGFELVSVSYGPGKKDSSLVVKPEHVAASREKAKPLTSPKHIIVWKTLQEAGGSLPENDLQQQVSSKLPSSKPDRRPQYIRETLVALVAKGLIVVSGGTVSIVGNAEFDALEEDPTPQLVKIPDEVPAPEIQSAPPPEPKKSERTKTRREKPPIAETPKPEIAVDDFDDMPHRAPRDLFMKRLNVGDDVAAILVREGFSSIEEISSAQSRLIEIQEFDEELAKELQSRAQLAVSAGSPA